jgi:hypothetical protein
MEEYAVHRTTTGKMFELTDLKGNPLKYDDYKSNFTRKHLRMLEPGQTLRSATLGIMLKRVQ